MNRQGHTGTVLLVIGAFLLVIAALYVMISSNSDLSLIKAELRGASDFASANHKYLLEVSEDIINRSIDESRNSASFENSFNDSLKKYASERRTSGLNNNLYAKLALGDYSLLLEDGKYELIVSGISENYNLNNNEITYSYSFKAIFDKMNVISIQIME